MKRCLRRFCHELAFVLALAIAMGGLCAHASTGSGSFVGQYGEAYEALERGSSGAAVEELQLRLIELGYLSGKADGDYGPKTEKAVEAFQREAGLGQTGEADAMTQEALFAASAPAAPEPAAKPKEQAKQRSSGSGQLVWIPNTGKRYHSNKKCSNMKNPTQVTIEEAVRLGFTPCKKCYN